MIILYQKLFFFLRQIYSGFILPMKCILVLTLRTLKNNVSACSVFIQQKIHYPLILQSGVILFLAILRCAQIRHHTLSPLLTDLIVALLAAWSLKFYSTRIITMLGSHLLILSITNGIIIICAHHHQRVIQKTIIQFVGALQITLHLR